jgi:hypothetical protein
MWLGLALANEPDIFRSLRKLQRGELVNDMYKLTSLMCASSLPCLAIDVIQAH